MMRVMDDDALSPELDHVGIAVNSLQDGRENYQKLGFKLTRLSYHCGPTSTGGEIQRWGSGNHCAMFEHGYLEVIGVTDPALFSNVRELLKLHQGAHIVALRVDDAHSAHRALLRENPRQSAPRVLQREVGYGQNGNQVRLAEFRNIYIDRGEYPEAQWLIIEHVTPQTLWQPHLMSHPNGALALDEVYIVSGTPERTAGRLAELCGQEAKFARNGFEIGLARGRAFIAARPVFESWGLLTPTSSAPHVVGFGVAVSSLAVTKKLLANNGVSFTESGGILQVLPPLTLGPIVRFLES